jgi:hypothetical protein
MEPRKVIFLFRYSFKETLVTFLNMCGLPPAGGLEPT